MASLLDPAFQPDSQPNIIKFGSTVGFDSYDDSDLDADMFQTKQSQWIADMRTLEGMTNKAWDFVKELYGYRSMTRALAGLDSNQQKTLLTPRIDLLKIFMNFVTNSRTYFLDFLKKNDFKNESQFSDHFLNQIINFFDIFIVLEKLRSSKPYFAQDFSTYQGLPGSNTSGEDQELSLFLAPSYSILKSVKDAITKNETILAWLVFLLNTSLDYLHDDQKLVTPKQKFVYMRSIPTIIFVLDDEQDAKAISKLKDINIPRASKVIKTYPIIPVYCDVFLSCVEMLKNLFSFISSPDFYQPNTTAKTQYDCLHHASRDRMKFAITLSSFKDQVLKAESQQLEKPHSVPDMELYKKTVDCFSLLSELTSRVILQIVWKCGYPVEGSLTPETTEHAKPQKQAANDLLDASLQNSMKKTTEETKDDCPYARAIKYNFKDYEILTLIEYIAMIKDLTSILSQSSWVVHPVLQTTIHHELQDVMHHHIRDILRKFASKSKGGKKKVAWNEEFLLLFQLGVDTPIVDDPALQGKKDTKHEEITLPCRWTPPSPSQLQQLRALLWLLIKREKKAGLLAAKDVDDKQEKSLKHIFSSSSIWSSLIDYHGTIAQLSDLSDLWFRESYLATDGRVQFPIDLSIPWLMIDQILKEREKDLVSTHCLEYVLYPLSIYNDVTNRLLYKDKVQYFYDEVEAEANLAFERLILKLRDKIFSYYKIQAASLLLDKGIKQEITEKMFRGKPANQVFHPLGNEFQLLFQQTHFSLMGRTIDIAKLLAERLNTLFVDNIKYAIQRFEASPISSVLSLRCLLRTIRLTHNLMSNWISIDEYDTLWRVANQSLSRSSFESVITQHIFNQIKGDLSSNFTYNTTTQRFVPSADSRDVNPFPRGRMPRLNNMFLYGKKTLTNIYLATNRLREGYVGIEHFVAMIELVGMEALPVFVSQLLFHLTKKANKLLKYYAIELYNLVPTLKWMLKNTYGTLGVFLSLDAAFRPFSAYDLIWTLEKGGYVQAFRHWGNFLVCFKLLDEALALHRSAVGLHTSLGQTIPITETKQTEAACQACYPNFELNGGIFKYVLNSVKQETQLFFPYWTASVEKFSDGFCDHPDLPIYQSHEFYRIWSSLQYSFCNRLFSHASFGDGFMWAGCTLIHFFGQTSRFEALDVSYQMEHILESEPPSSNYQVFQEMVRNIHELNSLVFRVLENFAPSELPETQIYEPKREDTAAPAAKGTARPVSIQSTPRETPPATLHPPAATTPPGRPKSTIAPDLPDHRDLPPSGVPPSLPQASHRDVPAPPSSQLPHDLPPAGLPPSLPQADHRDLPPPSGVPPSLPQADHRDLPPPSGVPPSLPTAAHRDLPPPMDLPPSNVPPSLPRDLPRDLPPPAVVTPPAATTRRALPTQPRTLPEPSPQPVQAAPPGQTDLRPPVVAPPRRSASRPQPTPTPNQTANQSVTANPFRASDQGTLTPNQPPGPQTTKRASSTSRQGGTEWNPFQNK